MGPQPDSKRSTRNDTRFLGVPESEVAGSLPMVILRGFSRNSSYGLGRVCRLSPRPPVPWGLGDFHVLIASSMG